MVLARCSNSINIGICSIVAAIFAATVVLCACAGAEAAIRISGLPYWQEKPALQSLNDVYKNIPASRKSSSKELLLETVANRIFSGYRVSVDVKEGDDVDVTFAPSEELREWSVEISSPDLKPPLNEWFRSDTVSFAEDVMSLLEGVPIDALNWSDKALLSEVEKIAERIVPGWKVSLLLSKRDKITVMTVSFTPQMPLVLAVTPSLVSTSLPAVFYEDMRGSVMAEVAPLIGVPVEWAAMHSREINSMAEVVVNDKRMTSWAAAEARANFKPSQISQLDMRVESRLYTISAWASVFAGNETRSAELGIHLGRKIEVLERLPIEMYGEGILGLQQWSMSYRLGLRFRPINDFWLGGEWDTRDDMWWVKFSMDAQPKRLYFWVRFGEMGELNGAVGWRATKNLSIETEYDSRDKDKWFLKLIGTL
ncbi:MAG: hypothetical protein Q4E17_01785 [Synergistes sp.]|nr:hypothetical protein [Synergistes sp.]